MAHDLRALLSAPAGRSERPSAALFDDRTVPSTPESGGRAAYDGARRRKGSKVHLAVDTTGHLLALHVSPADERDRAHVAALAAEVQEATGGCVEVAFADQGYTGPNAAAAAAAGLVFLRRFVVQSA
jgi:hypothetical protein